MSSPRNVFTAESFAGPSEPTQPRSDAKRRNQPASTYKPTKRQNKGERKERVSIPDTTFRGEHLLWCEKYAPNTEEHLAVASKKIEEIKSSILNSTIGNPKNRIKLLILTGPSGIGKSTTIRVLSKTMHFNLLEWKTPTKHAYYHGRLEEYPEAIISQFQTFMRQALRMDTGAFSHPTNNLPHKVLLIDDIPDLTTASVKAKFHNIIRASTKHEKPILLVIVFSPAWMEHGLARIASYDEELTLLSDIVPTDILESAQCLQVKMNGVVKTRVMAIMGLIGENEAHEGRYGRGGFSSDRHLTKKVYRPSQQELEHIAGECQGDIRHAINELQFLMLSLDISEERTNQDLSAEIGRVFIGSTDSRDIFHSLGKVLYRKRDEQGQLISSPSNIIQNLPISAERYLEFLHTNALHFADSSHKMHALLGALSMADAMGSCFGWDDSTGPEYMAQLAIRGIMSVLPSKPSGFYQMVKPSLPKPATERKEMRRATYIPIPSILPGTLHDEFNSTTSFTPEPIYYTDSDEDDMLPDSDIDWEALIRLSDDTNHQLTQANDSTQTVRETRPNQYADRTEGSTQPVRTRQSNDNKDKPEKIGLPVRITRPTDHKGKGREAILPMTAKELIISKDKDKMVNFLEKEDSAQSFENPFELHDHVTLAFSDSPQENISKPQLCESWTERAVHLESIASFKEISKMSENQRQNTLQQLKKKETEPIGTEMKIDEPFAVVTAVADNDNEDDDFFDDSIDWNAVAELADMDNLETNSDDAFK